MPDWDKIAKKQAKAWEALYDPMEIAEQRRRAKERIEKEQLRAHITELLKDKEFQKLLTDILKK